MGELSGALRVRVRGLASSGAGVAELPDGRVAFVHRTAPGDEAEVRVVRERPRWATARLERLHEEGPARRAAPCPRYATCGGCTLQHLTHAEQLRWKGRFVADALGRIAGIEVAPPEVAPAPEPFGYRNRVAFSFRRLRGGRVVAGFHALDRPAHVVDVGGECLLPEPALVGAWAALRAGWGKGARLLPGGGALRITLRRAPSGVVVATIAGGEPGWDGRPLADAVPEIAAFWHAVEGSAPVRAAGPADADATGRGAFVQVNEAAAAGLHAHVVAAAASAHRVIDAYCGIGHYGRTLAERGASVTGIERDPAACAEARREAPPGLTVLEGPVEAWLAETLPADLAILNPPRTGVHPDVPGLLVERGPSRVVYVGCDPATLARDLGRLAGAYRLDGLAAFDLFPQTAHVETVALLQRFPEAA